MDLFSTNKGNSLPPLAERLRPRSISEFIGQMHLLGENKPLRNMLDSKLIRSMILWGPPGSGKTTLAGIISNTSGYEFYAISAVSSGVKELKEIIDKANVSFKYYKNPIIVFIDEM
ncbi:MAG TPA: AAA family ATPase, partial [bacterium]|nr:AAA family ATPase [bacterium]